MFIEIMLVLIFLVLLWIAVGLQVIASSIRLLGKLFRPNPRKLRQLERNDMPFFLKVVGVKVLSYFIIRQISKKLR